MPLRPCVSVWTCGARAFPCRQTPYHIFCECSPLYDRSSRPEHLQEAKQLAEEMRQREVRLNCAVLSTTETRLNETSSFSHAHGLP
ncbi:hypothetical protein HETIRDRAFT_165318 [Heterobasidion irregulare TC 32-1]|uniref:Uncharacterized protein n=1 Tax=Heterobasidion irregulare (strain TC 32-1) TaxID=747525 RepID=W4K9R3_HETIT|nr:uncharacterized protein HETIRDRAFT_165318 [Heterobasidion irregulare TC 32-1]ETW82523.1 hypothetical protein HETIRDRAFT_165318 [Heterobasidion irregulare TC 32-1]